MENILKITFQIVGTFWLIGLYKIDTLHKFCVFPGSLNFNRVLEWNLFHKVKDSLVKSYAYKLQRWALFNAKNDGSSTHWWLVDLPYEYKVAFNRCASSIKSFYMFNKIFDAKYFDIIRIPDMDELYLTETNGESNVNSDKVFFTSHIDGPFGFIPYLSVYRCLIALNENSGVITHFPMNSKAVQLEYGNVLAFDYNREIHYIESEYTQNNDTSPRVVAKCHFCIYPKGFHRMGQFMMCLNAGYNRLSRNLFLHTIKPKNTLEIINSWIVLSATNLFVMVDIYIGHRNILFFVNAIYLFDLPGLYICFSALLYKTVCFLMFRPVNLEQVIFNRDILLLSTCTAFFYLDNLIN